MPGTDFDIMDWPTLDRIKDDFKIPMAAMWSDLQEEALIKISEALLPYTVLNQSQASSASIARMDKKQQEKYLHAWVPKDTRIFNNPNKERNIEMCYFGSRRNSRLVFTSYLTNHGIKIVYGGGEANEHLTTEQYADRYQRSKIALSFSRAGALHVVNARPSEVVPCGAMLLEQESFELMKWYIPYVDYVPYSNKKDMLKKARYYLTHDEERVKIAQSGQEKSERLYSAKRFWQIVIDKTLGTDSGASYTFEYAIPAESLAQLSPFTAFKLKLFNYLCGTKVGFVVFKMFNWQYWRNLILRSFFNAIRKISPACKKILPTKVFTFVLKARHKIIKGY
jgi:hypothetical protein